ncbi:MAG: hypothetical protein U9R44_06500 [Candidatus Omnitrophota bacterium]|nr:hypothetical protein [Candidatus Omnitrophota bacterium]
MNKRHSELLKLGIFILIALLLWSAVRYQRQKLRKQQYERKREILRNRPLTMSPDSGRRYYKK